MDDEKVKLEEYFAWLALWKNAPTHTIAGVQELYQQLLPTKVYYKRKTKSQVADEKCRLCGDSLENVRHILSGCSALAQSKYLQRHNNAFKIIHFEVPRSLNLISKGSKGYRSDESAHLPPMRPGFKSRLRLHTWVEFVDGPLPCAERFFSGYSGFPLSSKTNISKFHFDQESGRQRTTLCMCYLQIFIYLFIYYLLLKLNRGSHKSHPSCCMRISMRPPSGTSHY